jgi:hypothetical protein
VSRGGESVLDVDQIETSALGPDKIVVRVVGRWRGKRRAPDARAFLVVERDGRRHRFPGMPEPRRGGRGLLGRSVQWGANFPIPAEFEPRLGGEMSLWVGNSMIPLPTLDEPGNANSLAPAEEEGSRRAEVESHAVVPAAGVGDLQAQVAELASARVELEERLGQLRAELAKSTVAREAAESEAAGLRLEIDRLGGELAAARGSADASTGLQEARLLLQEARALTSRLRAQGTPAAADQRA